MKYDYDIAVIGMGPAGMAISAMASEMGLKVIAFEKNKVGGECTNVGCIPSKALLRMGEYRHLFDKMGEMQLYKGKKPVPKDIFRKIQKDIEFINQKKTMKMFKKIDLKFTEASFLDDHTIQYHDGKKATAKNIFIATGTKPFIPPIKGIEKIDILTNQNLFSIKKIPESMIIIGGGAIGCEMAQAFSRLGTKCTIVHMDPHLIPTGDEEAAKILEKTFRKKGIAVYNSQKIEWVKKGTKLVSTKIKGKVLKAEKLLVAAGRKMDFSSLKLENAKVKHNHKGIKVNKRLQTSKKHIYATGDCNGERLYTHAAMHQGMIALMNTISPFKFNFRKYVVPATLFTEPQISFVGAFEAKGEIIKTKYEDYGASIAEGVPEGFVKVIVSPMGKVKAACVVGEGSSDMINEWGLIIQEKISLFKILFLQHSFPSMSFLNKRIAEQWMMKKMPKLGKIARFLFRIRFLS